MFVFVWSLQVILSYKTGAVPIGTTAFLFLWFYDNHSKFD